MSLFSYSVYSYNRDDDHNVVDKVAYALATALEDLRSRTTFSYADKQDNVIMGGVELPPGSPPDLRSARVLANRMEAETRKNAKLCRQAIIALQCEFTLEENRECLLAFIDRMIERYGFGVIWAIHRASEEEGHDERNTHAHVIMSRRKVTADGLGPENESIECLDNKWLSEAEINWQRQLWADIVNAMFARKGLSIRISCETLEKQGIDRIPQVHVGPQSQAMTDQGKPHESKPAVDKWGHVTDWPTIDQGRSRSDLNGEIRATNLERDAFGPDPLGEQIHDLTRKIEILIHKITDLGSVIPEAMLPPWARRMLHAMQSLVERLAMQKAEAERRAEEREEEDKKREGLHERMRRMQSELREMKEVLARRQALQGFYMRLQLVVASMPPIKGDIEPPRRVISIKQYNVELHFKAETARAQVPPEYRPRIERPPVSLPDTKTGQGSFNAAVIKPPDNGGRARPPPPLTRNFNAQADPISAPYKAKVKVGFGPK